MEDQYNLVIKNVQFHDEGIYECDTGEQRLTVALQVAGELIQVIKLQISDQGTHNRHKILNDIAKLKLLEIWTQSYHKIYS